MNREQLIEKFGIEGCDFLQSLTEQIDELREFLGVVRVAHVNGFVLELSQPEMKGQTKPGVKGCGTTNEKGLIIGPGPVLRHNL